MSPVNLLLRALWLFAICKSPIRNTVLADELTDCRTYKGQRPFIWPLHEAFTDYLALSDPRSKSVFNELGDVNSYIHQQFNCTYHKPTHWVFQLDPEVRDMNIEIDFSERILMHKGSKHEDSKYNYTANFRLLYFLHHLRDNMLFSCEPTSILDPCERNFIQIHNHVMETNPTPFPRKSLKALSDALMASSRGGIVTRHFDFTSCPLKLFIKVENGNMISYRFGSQINTTHIKGDAYPTNETSYFENIYRFQETQEPHCVHVLSETEKCIKCRNVSQVADYTVNGVVFHGTYANTSLIYRGLFSVPQTDRSQRIFYFNWQISDSIIEEEMIQLLVPENIYANVPFQVTCRVSVFLFAYGTRISDQESPDFANQSIEELFSPFGYRNVVRTLTFQEANKAKTVKCFSPLKKTDRWVVKSKAVLVEHATPPFVDNTLENTTIFHTVSGGVDFVLAECNVSGNPIPTVRWILPSKLTVNESRKLNITKGGHFIRIQFPKWDAAFAGTYICTAVNVFGVTTKAITFQHEVEGSISKFAIIISSSLGSLALLLGILIGLLAWKIRKQRIDFEIQTQKAIEEFRNGMQTENMPEMDIENPNFSILQMPYNEAFEVPQGQWIIEDKILGTGQFGIVRMGSIVVKGERIPIAVKSLKSSVEIDEFKSFLFELKIMAYLQQHKNIVSLIAACTEGAHNRDIVIGVEFCDNGCLLNYLRKYQTSFQNMIGPDGKIVSDLSIISSNTSEYANVSVLSTHQLFRWAYHIACGMDYLRVRKVLHGDLAARNVLLTSRNVAKVGDFGLSRVLMNSENYTKQTQTALPWKWMAIESLKDRVFSFTSDVWAYGICLSELFTLGQSPYPGIGWSPDFIVQLENGMRMDKPVYCTTSLYKIIRTCWENDPHQRPSYAKIKRKLSQGLLRMSALITADKERQQQQRPPSSTGSNRSRSLSSSNSVSIPQLPDVLGVDDADIYSNLPRRTMNYYKNC